MNAKKSEKYTTRPQTAQEKYQEAPNLLLTNEIQLFQNNIQKQINNILQNPRRHKKLTTSQKTQLFGLFQLLLLTQALQLPLAYSQEMSNNQQDFDQNSLKTQNQLQQQCKQQNFQIWDGCEENEQVEQPRSQIPKTQINQDQQCSIQFVGSPEVHLMYKSPFQSLLSGIGLSYKKFITIDNKDYVVKIQTDNAQFEMLLTEAISNHIFNVTNDVISSVCIPKTARVIIKDESTEMIQLAVEIDPTFISHENDPTFKTLLDSKQWMSVICFQIITGVIDITENPKNYGYNGDHKFMIVDFDYRIRRESQLDMLDSALTNTFFVEHADSVMHRKLFSKQLLFIAKALLSKRKAIINQVKLKFGDSVNQNVNATKFHNEHLQILEQRLAKLSNAMIVFSDELFRVPTITPDMERYIPKKIFCNEQLLSSIPRKELIRGREVEAYVTHRNGGLMYQKNLKYEYEEIRYMDKEMETQAKTLTYCEKTAKQKSEQKRVLI